jgi:hypothetical protein
MGSPMSGKIAKLFLREFLILVEIFVHRDAVMC